MCLQRMSCGVVLVSARQGEENDEDDEKQDGENEDAAFWAGGSAAEKGFADGMSGEEMEFDHGTAVGDAAEEGLGPVPCGVEADGPPERAGAPETEAEDHGGETGREEADGRLAGIAAVDKAEEGGEDDS